MKRLVFTGATGFIGRHCLPLLLEKGYEVFAITSRLPQPSSKNLHFLQINLLDQKQVEKLFSEVKPSHLLHLAWYVEHKKYWNSHKNLSWVAASLQLLEQFYIHGGKRFVAAGTCAEYDWSSGYCHEKDTPLIPSTLYGTTKASLNKIVEAFCGQYHLSSAWGRLFHIYGPYEHLDRFVPSIITKLLCKESVPCSHGNQIRDFLYVEDVADAFVTLLDSRINGAVNIASGQSLSLKEIGNTLADLLDGSSLIQWDAIPAFHDAPRILPDTHRLFDELHWRPHFSLLEGLSKTIEWWKTTENHSTANSFV